MMLWLLGLASSVSHGGSRSLDFLCFVCSGDKIFLGHDKVPVFPPVLIRTIENMSVWTSAISFAIPLRIFTPCLVPKIKIPKKISGICMEA